MSIEEPHYHPFLFTMMILAGMAEAALTVFLVSTGNYHSLLLFILFNAAWTVAFAAAYMLWLVDGAKHLLANIASSIFWLTVTVILWGVSAGIFHNAKTGNCANSPTISRLAPSKHAGMFLHLNEFLGCRQSLTVEALAWVEFALSAFALFWTCVWVESSGRRHARDSVRDSRRMV
ncbi:hypothetical protein B0H12DRAFT_1202404 [Mycena haematopus]|nr:hypothetical protein B0H12DRAFT_1202404 [Mycena haematopus]